MTAIAEQLDYKLQHWEPTTARKVEQLVSKLIEQADREASSGTGTAPGRRDPFFADQNFHSGPVPADLSLNHDRHLHDEE
jgi:hypothetical protein